MCIQTATAYITTAIAFIVAIITVGQWITNRARLRHELFDRCYTMYETIATFLANIAVEGTVRESADLAFLRNTNKACSVFGCDIEVKNLVSEIYRLASGLRLLDTELVSLPPGDQRTENVNRQTNIKDQLQAILVSMEGKFEKYLRLAH